jgi:hypothetical protein
MPKVTLTQTNFTAGELAPRLLGRVDIARYQNGAKTIENAHPVTHGGCRRRPGTLFVAAAKNANKTARLIPYVFSRDQAYMLEFGDQYLRVFKDGGQIESSPGVPYEIATPYTEAMLPDLDYVQGADTMFIAHPSVAIYRLRRFGHASWDMSAAPFSVTPFDEIGVNPATTCTLSSAAVGSGRTFTAGAASFEASDVGREIWSSAGVAKITGYTSTTVVTATITVAFQSTSLASGAWTIAGSPQTTCTPSAKEPIGASITLTLGAAGWRSADVGKFVRINDGLAQITGFTSATIVNATIKQALTATVAAPALAWSLEASVWGGANGYPRAVTLHEQRLIAAGSDGFPQTIWGSSTGIYLDFTLGTADDDAFSFKIASNQVNPITHLGQIKQMLVLTYGGEFSIEGGVEKPVTPTNVQVKSQSSYGCNGVRPARIGNELLFVQRSGRKVRAMSYQYTSDAFGSPDLTVLAQHITESGIVDMAYQQEPDSLLWCVRDDGVLVSLTVEREQDVVGWARHTTDGLFESVATIPVADGEQVWAIVKRTINGSTVRYVELLDDTVNMDCTVLGNEPLGSTVWSGLDHLEGKTVDIVADGAVMEQQVVTSGQITLERAAVDVEIGLHYESLIELLDIEINSSAGSAQGNAVRTGEAIVRLLESSGCDIQGQPIPFRRFGAGVLDQPVQPFTGDKRIELLGWQRTGGSVTIRQTQPLPMHVLAVIRKISVND